MIHILGSHEGKKSESTLIEIDSQIMGQNHGPVILI